MQIAIIDCGAGNLHSVQKAFAHVLKSASDENISDQSAHKNRLADATLTIAKSAADLKTATHIVLPGVGAFAHCMQGLRALDGVVAFLNDHVRDGHTPFLGICVGMQMLLQSSEEFGDHQGLGWFEGKVTHITPDNTHFPVPHMGWNALHFSAAQHSIMSNIKVKAYAYFVHSYHATQMQEKHIIATVDYGGPIVAMIGRDNIVATQFHPEKSQHLGLSILKNFLIQ
jgi:glutamine amidotransferase